MFDIRSLRGAVAQSLLAAPAWAQLGLTVRDERMRERAAEALAARIASELDDDRPVYDDRQLALPI